MTTVIIKDGEWTKVLSLVTVGHFYLNSDGKGTATFGVYEGTDTPTVLDDGFTIDVQGNDSAYVPLNNDIATDAWVYGVDRSGVAKW